MRPHNWPSRIQLFCVMTTISRLNFAIFESHGIIAIQWWLANRFDITEYISRKIDSHVNSNLPTKKWLRPVRLILWQHWLNTFSGRHEITNVWSWVSFNSDMTSQCTFDSDEHCRHVNAPRLPVNSQKERMEIVLSVKCVFGIYLEARQRAIAKQYPHKPQLPILDELQTEVLMRPGNEGLFCHAEARGACLSSSHTTEIRHVVIVNSMWKIRWIRWR